MGYRVAKEDCTEILLQLEGKSIEFVHGVVVCVISVLLPRFEGLFIILETNFSL